MAIFITGDTHGDFTRFKKKIFYEQAELTKDDCVMIAGDFGGIWDGGAEERHWLDWLEAKPFTTLFVSGNHENFDMLAEFPIEDWHGGRVQRVRPSVIHLMRGQIYDIQGRTFFTMGGASSHDIQDGILEPEAGRQGRDVPGEPSLLVERRSCPARRSTRPPGPTWTVWVGRWTTSSATAVPLRCRTN